MEEEKYNFKYLESMLNEILELTNSPKWEEFYDYLENFSIYCIPDKKDEWCNDIKKLIVEFKNNYLEIENTTIINEYLSRTKEWLFDEILGFICTGRLMKLYAETKSWEKIDSFIQQIKFYFYYSKISDKMLRYSLIGPEFVKRYDYYRLDRDDNFSESWYKANKYLETRKAEETKIIYLLANILQNEKQRKSEKVQQIIEEDTYKDSISDGHHTFEELYKQRAILFATLCNSYKELSFKTKKHFDEENDPMYNDDFLAGIYTPEGIVTYHIKLKYWDLFDIPEIERGPKYDGYDNNEVLKRIISLSK